MIDNGTGVAGQSNSSLINGRALDENGSGSTADIADAIEWAADQGADVINLSLGGGGYTDTMKNAVSYATDNGSLVVAAAGNNGSSSVSYPAAYSECVAVSAVDDNGGLASFSQYGESVELCAPGVDVLSTTTEGRGSYERLSGTSMATPVTSGVAGLTLAKWDLTNTELRSHLKNTAEDIGLPADEQGSGQVDALAAVTTDPGGSGGGGGRRRWRRNNVRLGRRHAVRLLGLRRLHVVVVVLRAEQGRRRTRRTRRCGLRPLRQHGHDAGRLAGRLRLRLPVDEQPRDHHHRGARRLDGHADRCRLLQRLG